MGASDKVETVELQGKAGRVVVNRADFPSYHAQGYAPVTPDPELAAMVAPKAAPASASGAPASTGGSNGQGNHSGGGDGGAAGGSGDAGSQGTGNQGGNQSGGGSQPPVMPDYAKMDFAQLKEYAEEAGVEGFKSMRKAAIAAALVAKGFIPKES